MKSDRDDKQRSHLYLIASSVADHQQIDWQSAESSAPPDQLATIRGLRIVSQISLATSGEPDEHYAHEEVRVLSRRPYELEQWGPLLIEENIGSGSFGEVFRAKDPNLERTVALKLYHLDRIKGKQQATELLIEGRLLARVQHPNVATVYGAESHAGRIGIWMEHIAGVTLASILEEQGTLDVEEVMRIGRDVCRALSALHDAGIVHRDVKASNIMRAEDGRVVLMDLGVSREIDDCDSEKLYGTPLFVAPEVLSTGASTPQSDLYSVGVLLFLMLCGEYPVPGATLAEIFEVHQTGRTRRIRDLRPDLPENFIQIVERALSPDPLDRFTTASEFEQALSAALGDALETGRLPTWESLKRKRRKRLLWGVGAVLSLAAVLLVGYLILWPNLSRDEGVPSDVQRVLVSYLENRTGDESLDPIGPITADWISQVLAHSGVVNVIPTMTVLQAMNAAAAVEDELTEMERLRVLAEASAATIVLSGAYYLVSDSLRFHLQATDMRSEELLFSLTAVSGPSERPIETIDQVREKVMGAMVTHLSPTQDDDMAYLSDLLHKVPSYEAYKEYFAGVAKFGVDYGQSLYHFRKALEIDSTMVAPALWIAAMHINLGQPAKADSIVQQLERRRDLFTPFERHALDAMIAGLRGPRGENLRQWKMAAKYAPKDFTINYLVGLHEINMNNPRGTIETYAKLEYPPWYIVTWRANWRFHQLARAYHHLGDYEQELATVNRAISYYPDDMDLRGCKVRALAALGRIQEIHAVIDECLTMPVGDWNPSDVMRDAAKELRVQGQFDTAREFANRAVDWCNQQSDPAEYRDDQAEALRLAERWAEAQAVFAELAAEDPDNLEYQGKLGTLAVRLGDERKAREIFDTLRHLERPYLEGKLTYWSACISALLGEREQAVALLKEAWDQGLPHPDIKWRDMDLEPLRDYPPFQEMIKPKG